MSRTATLGALAVAVLLTSAVPASAHAADGDLPPRSIRVGISYWETVQESTGTAFVCPPDMVLVGQMYMGGTGDTTYRCGRIFIDGQQVQVSAPTWSSEQVESDSDFQAPGDLVLVGRQHTGDTNGLTRYATASLKISLKGEEKDVWLRFPRWGLSQSENSSNSTADAEEVMTGRKHKTGQTQYRYSQIWVWW